MRYAKIEEYEVSNGHLGGQSLYVQGCRFRCPNCFNSGTWDFNGGYEWTQEIKKRFLELASRPYIKRISLLGGECLADENLDGILDLIHEIHLLSPPKTIWLYSGYAWEQIFDDKYHYHPKTAEKLSTHRWKRQQIVSQCDVMVDGCYIDSKRDITLKWRGSSNQRVIDVQKSLGQGEVILWTT